MLTKTLFHAAFGLVVTSAASTSHVSVRDVEYETADCAAVDSKWIGPIRIEDYGELDHKGLKSAAAQGCTDAKIKMDGQKNVTRVEVWVDNVQGPWVWLSDNRHGALRLQINVQDTNWKNDEEKWAIDVEQCVAHTQGAFTTPDRCYRESGQDTWGGVVQVKGGPQYTIFAYDQKEMPQQ